MSETMERAEISAAKDAVMDALHAGGLDYGEHDLIALADRAVEALVKHGALIPPWFPTLLEGKPAQGYFPTASQMEAWEGRKVTASRVTGR